MGKLTNIMSASWSLPAARRYPRWGWRARPPLSGQFQWPAGIAEMAAPSAGAKCWRQVLVPSAGTGIQSTPPPLTNPCLPVITTERLSS